MSKIIYVVDDEPEVLELLGLLLRRLDASWQVMEFSTPAQALTAARTTAPNLVLADQNLSGMTGHQMLDSIRQMAPNTIRIIVSAQAQWNVLAGGLCFP